MWFSNDIKLCKVFDFIIDLVCQGSWFLVNSCQSAFTGSCAGPQNWCGCGARSDSTECSLHHLPATPACSRVIVLTLQCRFKICSLFLSVIYIHIFLHKCHVWYIRILKKKILYVYNPIKNMYIYIMYICVYTKTKCPSPQNPDHIQRFF